MRLCGLPTDASGSRDRAAFEERIGARVAVPERLRTAVFLGERPCDVLDDELRETEALCNARGSCRAVITDVRDRAAVDACVAVEITRDRETTGEGRA